MFHPELYQLLECLTAYSKSVIIEVKMASLSHLVASAAFSLACYVQANMKLMLAASLFPHVGICTHQAQTASAYAVNYIWKTTIVWLTKKLGLAKDRTPQERASRGSCMTWHLPVSIRSRSFWKRVSPTETCLVYNALLGSEEDPKAEQNIKTIYSFVSMSKTFLRSGSNGKDHPVPVKQNGRLGSLEALPAEKLGDSTAIHSSEPYSLRKTCLADKKNKFIDSKNNRLLSEKVDEQANWCFCHGQLIDWNVWSVQRHILLAALEQ